MQGGPARPEDRSMCPTPPVPLPRPETASERQRRLEREELERRLEAHLLIARKVDDRLLRAR